LNCATHLISTYTNFESTDGFSKVVNADEIKSQDYNLNVSTYVHPVDNDSSIDIIDTIKDLNQINISIRDVEQKLDRYLKELGYID
jgi:type I restriction enzyme M protein